MVRPQHCMAAMRWRVVVADESHMMRTHNKAPDAAFTEAAAAIGRAADRLLLLSGTPSLNRPFDLFRQVRVDCYSTGAICSINASSITVKVIIETRGTDIALHNVSPLSTPPPADLFVT